MIITPTVPNVRPPRVANEKQSRRLLFGVPVSLDPVRERYAKFDALN